MAAKRRIGEAGNRRRQKSAVAEGLEGRVLLSAVEELGVEPVGQWGECNAVAVSGQYAYVGRGDALNTLDVQSPDQPRQVGTVRLPGIVRDVVVSGSLAYVAASDGGLQIVDVSNPEAPVLCGTYDTSDSAFGVFVAGSMAYVADQSAGLQLVRVQEPGVVVGAGEEMTIDSSRWIKSLQVEGRVNVTGVGGVSGCRRVGVSAGLFGVEEVFSSAGVLEGKS